MDGNFTNQYKTAYEKRDVLKCVDLILIMGECYGVKLKRNMLRSGCWKNPLSYKYEQSEQDFVNLIYEKAVETINLTTPNAIFKHDLMELHYASKILFLNAKYNNQCLSQTGFKKFTLSEQLRMICIYIQDQTRLMNQILQEKNEPNGTISGMEGATIRMKTDHDPNVTVSIVDNYEGMLERFDTLIRYLYFDKKKDLKKDDTNNHGHIHHLLIPSFEIISYVANEKHYLDFVEEGFRYCSFNLLFESFSDDNPEYIFDLANENKRKSFVTGGIRKTHEIQTNVVGNSLGENSKYLERLAKDIKYTEFEKICIEKDTFDSIKEEINPLMKSYLYEIKPYYLTIEFGNTSIENYIFCFEFLYIISKLYINAVLQDFDQDDMTCYNFLTPVISLHFLTDMFSKLYDLPKNVAEETLNYFVFDSFSCNNEDVFSNPLIRVANGEILFCESLITQMNLDRSINIVLKKNDVDTASVGKDFEEEMKSKLSKVNNLRVNTNKIEFKAYDGDNVEFDFIAMLDDYLIIMELKSLEYPYSYKEFFTAEKAIKHAVSQVHRRLKVVKKNWKLIKDKSSIDLPENVPPDAKIIPLVCTDIYSFTGLKYEGIAVVDKSTILKYFTNPYVTSGILAKDKIEDFKTITLWRNSAPEGKEFLSYLNNPVTTGRIPDCLEKNYSRILPNSAPFRIAFSDFVLKSDPYKKMSGNPQQITNSTKTGRNDKCPCDSGKKYKHCCGK